MHVAKLLFMQDNSLDLLKCRTFSRGPYHSLLSMAVAMEKAEEPLRLPCSDIYARGSSVRVGCLQAFCEPWRTLYHTALCPPTFASGAAKLAFCFCSILAAQDGCSCSALRPDAGKDPAAVPPAGCFGGLALPWAAALPCGLPLPACMQQGGRGGFHLPVCQGNPLLTSRE